MTSPRRLTFLQRLQIRKAREASNLKAISQPSARRDRRAAKYARDAAERRSSRREFDGEARRAAMRYREAADSEELRMDMEEANFRALRERGMTPEFIYLNDLQMVKWDNPALQSLLKKWDALARRGLTRYQIVTELERRLSVVQKDRHDNQNRNRMLDLVREHYGTDARGRLRHQSHLVSTLRKRAARRNVA